MLLLKLKWQDLLEWRLSLCRIFYYINTFVRYRLSNIFVGYKNKAWYNFVPLCICASVDTVENIVMGDLLASYLSNYSLYCMFANRPDIPRKPPFFITHSQFPPMVKIPLHFSWFTKIFHTFPSIFFYHNMFLVLCIVRILFLDNNTATPSPACEHCLFVPPPPTQSENWRAKGWNTHSRSHVLFILLFLFHLELPECRKLGLWSSKISWEGSPDSFL